jgi:phosphate transport system substrate-binding protein
MGGSVMNIGRIIHKNCIACLFAMLALLAATCAQAATTLTLVGGGAIWPAPAYVGSGAYTKNQVTFDPTGASYAISYCLSGDPVGMSIFDGVAGTVQGACPNASGVFQGFGAATVGRTTLQQPDFGSTSVPYSQANLNDYIADHASGDMPIQFPVLAGAVGIALNMHDDEGVVLNESNVNFSDAQICAMFSGQITTWNDPALASAFTLPAGDTVSGPIDIQYLSEGDGTTFAFFNHLSSLCGGSASAHFVTSDVFATGVALYLPTLPSNWTGSNNYHALIAALNGTSGSLGFIAADFAINAGVPMASVDGSSPVADFGTKMTISASDQFYNEVVNGVNPTTGSPVLQAISPAPTTRCIAVVDPSSYAAPGSGYPIVALAYLLGNAQGNGTDLTDNGAFLSSFYNPRASIQDTGTGTGLAQLSTSITAAQVVGCLVN